MKLPIAILLLIVPLAAPEMTPASDMKSAADNFLGLLDEGKRAKAMFPFDADARENFRFTPQVRTGLSLGEMDGPQRAAAINLLKSVLSDKGRLKAMQIIQLESVLGEIEKRPDFRDSGKYYVSFFGKPGDEKAWGWKFEGHHLSLNYTVAGGKLVSDTPSFFGANPAEVREGEHQGLRVLKAEDELAHALLSMLLDDGKKEVVFSDKAPAEILTAENRQTTALDPVGNTADTMSGTQRKALLELVAEYLDRHRKELAESDMRRIIAAGTGKVRFGWAGGTKPGEAWYYRIHGPTFLMEAANTQNNANHIHATWRDFDGDFGHDILAEHYREHEKIH